MTRAGSPGSTRTIRKTMRETPSRVMTEATSRWARYRRANLMAPVAPCEPGDYRGRAWDERADVWILLAEKV